MAPPSRSLAAVCAAGAMGLMAAPTLFTQATGAGQAASAARHGGAAAQLRGGSSSSTTQAAAAAQPRQLPMSGIVAPSLVGAVVVGTAVASLGSRAVSSQRIARRASEAAAVAVVETPSEAVPPPPPVFDPSKEMGIGPAPVGFFDPLGFCKDKDEEGFRKLRSAELKHGRVAMMASIGAVFQHFVKLPGFESAKGTFGAIWNPAGSMGFYFLCAVCSVVELAWRERPDSRWAGDYGDPLNVNMMSDEMRNKEVNNGRMAMISVLGIFLAEVATGKDAMQQFGL
eukprot:TRINITY_DN4061_c1_g1_i1.p1 TRINITY_DN4061_c1_g1~~TRINITY_DN4061_c1_g1_i1.p1  ORF type:complete len:284 (+),score=86.97 TRINITY_DN4061_c1_g1_i1:47-898(+)